MFPSPEFLSSLSFIKKFYPVLNFACHFACTIRVHAPAFTLCSLVLHAPRVPQKQFFALFGKSRKTSRQGYVRSTCSLLHLLAIRTRCTPSVRKFAVPIGARVESVISNMNEYFVPIGYMKALYRHLRYEPMSLQRQIHTKI